MKQSFQKTTRLFHITHLTTLQPNMRIPQVLTDIWNNQMSLISFIESFIITAVLKCSKVMKNPIFTLFYDWSVKVNKVSRKRCFLTLNLITALLCHMYVFLSCCSTDTTVQSRNFLLLDSFDGNSSADEVTLHPIYQSVHLRAEPQHDDRVITLTEIHIDDDDEQFVLHILVCESVSSPLQ